MPAKSVKTLIVAARCDLQALERTSAASYSVRPGVMSLSTLPAQGLLEKHCFLNCYRVPAQPAQKIFREIARVAARFPPLLLTRRHVLTGALALAAVPSGSAYGANRHEPLRPAQRHGRRSRSRHARVLQARHPRHARPSAKRSAQLVPPGDRPPPRLPARQLVVPALASRLSLSLRGDLPRSSRATPSSRCPSGIGRARRGFPTCCSTTC